VLVLMCTYIEMSWQGSVSDAIPLTVGVECDPATLNKELLMMVYRNMGAQRFTENTQLLSQTVEAQFPSIAQPAMAALDPFLYDKQTQTRVCRICATFSKPVKKTRREERHRRS
jgi:hypothetical protein